MKESQKGLSIVIAMDCKIKIIDWFAMNYDISKYFIDKYFSQIFFCLKTDSMNYLEKARLRSYCNIVDHVFEKLFNSIKKENQNILTELEFVKGLAPIYYEGVNKLQKSVFCLLDSDKDGFVGADDLRNILFLICKDQQIVIQKNGLANKVIKQENYNKGNKLELDNDNNDMVIKKEIEHLLSTVFYSGKQKLSFSEFENISNYEYSDIFLIIYLYLRSKMPFQSQLQYLLNRCLKDSNLIPVENIESIAPVKFLVSNLLLKPIFSMTIKFLDSKTKICTKSIEKEMRERLFNYSLDNINLTPNNTHLSLSQLYQNSTSMKNIQEKSLEIVKEQIAHNIIKDSKTESQNELSQKLNLSLSEKKEVDFQFKVPLIWEGSEESVASATFIHMNGSCTEKISGNIGFLNTDNSIEMLNASLVNNEIYFFKGLSNDWFKESIILNPKSNFKLEDTEANYKVNGSNKIYYSMKINCNNKIYLLLFQSNEERKSWFMEIRNSLAFSNIQDSYYIISLNLKTPTFYLFLGKNKATMEKVIIKTIYKEEYPHIQLDSARFEVQILSLCNHPNIVRLIEFKETENFLFIIFERFSKLTLYDYLEKDKITLTEDKVKTLFHSLATAIFYLHSLGIIHRNVTLQNMIFVGEPEDLNVKLINFDLAKMMGMKELCDDPFGTPLFSAPEILKEEKYDFRVDIWSLGVCLFYMLARTFPFDSETPTDLVDKILNSTPFYDDLIWNHISLEAKDLVSKMLIQNPDLRIGIKDILLHKWIVKDNPALEKLRSTSQTTLENFHAFSFSK